MWGGAMGGKSLQQKGSGSFKNTCWGWVQVVCAFNPSSTQEAEASGSLWIWSTARVPGQPGLHGETLSQKSKIQNQTKPNQTKPNQTKSTEKKKRKNTRLQKVYYKPKGRKDKPKDSGERRLESMVLQKQLGTSYRCLWPSWQFWPPNSHFSLKTWSWLFLSWNGNFSTYSYILNPPFWSPMSWDYSEYGALF